MDKADRGKKVAAVLWIAGLLFPLPLLGQDPLPPPPDASPRAGQTDDPPGKLPPIPKVTTPSRTPTPLPQSASSVTLIEGDDLRSLGVRFLTDAFRTAPGLEVQRLSSTESNVTMRGYNDDTSASQGILGLVDGRLVYNEFFGSVIWDTLPVALGDIERVELVRGPGSFVYGPNAMHGLVSITTRSPLDYEEDELFLTASGGSYNSSEAAALYVRREGNSALKTKVVWDDLDEFDPAGQNARDKSFFEARFETQFDDRGEHRLDLAGGVTRQKFNVIIPQFAGIPTALFDTEVMETYLRVEHTLGGLSTRASWSQFDAIGNPDVAYSRFEVLSDVADVDLQFTESVEGWHTVTGGTGYRYATYETEDLDVSEGRHNTGLAWIFLQDEFEAVEEAVWITGGMRVDYHTVAGWSASPRLAAVWQFMEEHYVRASGGYGFRNPSLRELWFNMPVFGGLGTITGNDKLEPEQIRSFELGYSGRPTGAVQVTGNAYYNLVDDLVEFRAVSPTVFAPLNEFKEDAFGGEIGVEVQLLPSLWSFGNYSYGVRRDRDTGRRNPTAPRHKAAAGLRTRMTEAVVREDWEEERQTLEAMVWANFFDGVDFVDTAAGAVVGSIDSYILLNARVAIRLPVEGSDARIFIQAFNLLDHDHREQSAADPYGAIYTAGVEITW